MTIVSVSSQDQVAEIVRLAGEIWQEHYTSIIGQEQVGYMLKMFQSQNAITAQLSDGYEYYLADWEGQNVGYVGIVARPSDATLMLSKLYVRNSARGLGVGKGMLQFVEDLCRKRKLTKLWLTVNKNNTASIAWYTRMAFRNAGSVMQDIGRGFVMDDFRLEKTIV